MGTRSSTCEKTSAINFGSLEAMLVAGSTQATRFAAAKQIGDIAKSHPQELNSLLKKVSQYLRSKNWDTRVAAAHAVGAIAENVKHISLKELLKSLEVELAEVGFSDASRDVGVSFSNICPDTTTGLSFKSFDINKVLEFGSPLLASGGQNSLLTFLASGLDFCEQFMDVSDVIKDEDLMAQKTYSGFGSNNGYWALQSGHNIQQLVATMVPGHRPKRLSARELNLLKRKAKVSARDQTKSSAEDDDLQKSVTSKVAYPDTLDIAKDSNDTFDEDNLDRGQGGSWPFRSYVDQLVHDIFDPIWEVRHGAMMALREILTHQGSCAGVYHPNQRSEYSLLVGFDEKTSIGSTRSIGEIDLNMQYSANEFEPELKRHKAGGEFVSLHDTVGFTGKHMEDSTCTSIEGYPLETTSTSVTYKVDIDHVKVEPDLFIDDFSSKLKGENVESDKLSFESCASLSKMSFPANLPETSEVAKLIKLARHSWAKNWEFLQDCAIRFLCVLSLDRFGDYVSDQVVSPVRETCSQALGAVLKYMQPSLVVDTLKILLKMQCRQEWEVRHGSLLGIKYLVAVRPEMVAGLLDYVLPACKAGLQDPDDDVRAVAAEALIPTAAAIASLDDQVLHSIVMLLWDILLDLDDLSPSTSSVMNLLAEIYSQPEMVPKMMEKLSMVGKQEIDLNEVSLEEQGEDINKSKENPYMLSTLTPRLWPFMRHTITSVRHSAIRTLLVQASKFVQERLLEVSFTRSSSMSVAARFWPTSILSDALRIVYQNMLLESNDEILCSSERVWRLLLQCPEKDLEVAGGLYFSSWIEIATTPYGSALDTTKMFWPVALPRKSHFRAAAKMRAVMLEGSAKENALQDKSFDLSASIPMIIIGADSEKSVIHTRVTTATALGVFASKLPETSLQVVVDSLWKDISSSSGVQRQVASMVIVAWFKELKRRGAVVNQGFLVGLLDHVKQWLLDLLSCSDPSFPTKGSVDSYAELSRTYSKMRNEANHLLFSAQSAGIDKDYISNIKFEWKSLTVDEAINFASSLTLPAESSLLENLEKHLLDDMESAKRQLVSTSGYLKCVQNNLHVTVTALVAAAVVWMSQLPSRLNPIILPLMAAVKREQEELLQEKAAEALAELIFQCIGRKPSPNDKLIKNLCSLTCLDTSETPQAAVINSVEVIEDQYLLSFGKVTKVDKSKIQMASSGEDKSKVEGFLSRRGSEMALKHLCEKFGSSLFDKLPKMWDCLTEVLKPIAQDDEQILHMANPCMDNDPQALINNIQLVRSIAPVVNESIRPQLLTILPCVLACVRHHHMAVRLAASRCITSMAKVMESSVMGAVVENVVPMLSDSTSAHARQGAGMLVHLLVQGLGVELVPYAPLFVVPLLRCMADSNHAVRQTVTHSFAALVPLLPLARGVPSPTGLSETLLRNTEDTQFLEQLLDNSHIEDYNIPFDLKVALRRYQQEGINWLAFLKRFKLHGILCDDMGLGKTLQASAIVASDIVEQRAHNSSKDLLSLIICPSTLVGHWAYEIEKYIDNSLMVTLQYVGSNPERALLRDQFEKCNVVITSYDIVRKDIDFLGNLSWNYCILDEGHIIKNSKSKITSAVKQLKAEHRLILSGTPIQNNVLELWSLFDFLMPGFLGTERQFQTTYGKPLSAARDSKCSAKDAEAGVLAMEALHKQVMPFLLRRTKDEVLSDLPEKIIQDRYCDLSPVQLKLYEHFSFSSAKKEITSLVKEYEASSVGESTASKATSHVFQAMQYLLKLCSHPLLVIGEKTHDSLVSLLSDVIPGCTDLYRELHELRHSPKFVALQEILQECGIGLDQSSSDDALTVGQHRVLIFAQRKAVLDIIEKDLFRTHMKSVAYLRLDGSVESEKRYDIVKAFNSDPTIDVLLLTTHVGGLGLNLTSADTLVFMEHDWNPMKDLQAMDRAHRLGQRKVVNVHRLIMRGTLEEKVMSLQKFKVTVANAVINAENASLKTMNTDQLLDLFASSSTVRMGTQASTSIGSNMDNDPKSLISGKGLKSIISGLGELWDQSQYEEYNLNQFLEKLNS
ncbi:hypothetical protein ZIOFF_036646 [Zingiber officinale]|uniref:TATA-binding protein-associated factor BTAF1 n=1 Tax=Zingiber officinale TaxID=94328 RepID=A0A8J5GAB9_ZINOF|nr:hypothetical protein ZIOFF_036646 [Zingiber officinale]